MGPELLFSIALAILLLFSAFMSATETSLFSLSSLTVKNYHYSSDNRKKLIYHLLLHPRDLLVTLMMLNIFANIIVQNIVSSLFGEDSSWFLQVGIPLVLTLVFGEVIPKSLALPNNEKIAYKMAPSIAHASRALGPVRRFLTKITGLISRSIFFFLKSEEEINQKELEEALKGCKSSGVLSKEEFTLMEGYLHLRNASAKELMKPREDIYFYDISQPIERLDHLFFEKRYTRIPICEGDLEKLIGILSFRPFFLHKKEIDSPSELKKFIRQPLYIPESLNAWTLLHDLREKKEDLAIVIDEYGSISGLITQEDLIESVIGKIVHKREEKPKFTRSGEDVIIASGKLEVDQVEEIFGLELENKRKAVTIGGWLMEQMGDIPQAGVRYVTDDFLFYVLAADPNRVRRVYIRRLKGPKSK